jgi:hypothetical protein
MAGSASIDVAAIVLAESKRGSTFTARDFCDFLAMAGVSRDEEQADEILSDLAECGSLRQIGPGVYACIEDSVRTTAPMEHPIW